MSHGAVLCPCTRVLSRILPTQVYIHWKCRVFPSDIVHQSQLQGLVLALSFLYLRLGASEGLGVWGVD